MSFRIKSTHTFVGQPKDEDEVTTDFDSEFHLESDKDNNRSKKSHSTHTHTTNTITDVKKGSAKGIAVRATVTAQEDHY
jgi:hypothetical protein